LDGVVSASSASQNVSCSAFNSRVWAQTVFDERPWSNEALDPDHDGLACEELPPGIAPALWTDVVPADAMPVELENVTDGDSIDVIVDGRREQVRLVGIDSRESGGPYQEVECYGPEAATFLRELLGIGGEIYLEQDQEDRDQYGRLLRWVWADFGTGEVYLLNEALVRAGYAERFRDTPNRRYVQELITAEDFARRYDLGLWGTCESEGPRLDSAPPAVPIATAPARAPGSECDRAYPDVCIPSPPPDLQCSDVPYSHFRVIPPDPHNFDGNQDGVACEGPG
jgi:micrococcal nuclease